MTKDTFKSSTKVARLWKHECERVFRDRLVNESDMERYDEFVTATLKSNFKDEPMDQIVAEPNIFTSFIECTADETPLYNQVRPLPPGARVHIQHALASTYLRYDIQFGPREAHVRILRNCVLSVVFPKAGQMRLAGQASRSNKFAILWAANKRDKISLDRAGYVGRLS
jgi:hypothetical protein